MTDIDIQHTNRLRCFIDGDNLCIVDKDFINLQESDTIFITITSKQHVEIRELVNKY